MLVGIGVVGGSVAIAGFSGSSVATRLAPLVVWCGVAWALMSQDRGPDGESAPPSGGSSGGSSQMAARFRRNRWVWILLIGLAALSYSQSGRFHGEGRFVHHHELFHYTLGSRYSPELGYDGLYVATYRALIDIDPSFAETIPWIKNLRNYELEGGAVALTRSEGVLQRFSPDRWRAFQADVRYFASKIPPGGWRVLLIDHGYNATPFWNTAGRFYLGDGELSDGLIARLVTADLVLLLAAIAVVIWAFGFPIGALFGIFFLTNALSPFGFTGGAYLRWLWLAAAVIGFGLLYRGRFAWAGVAFAVATLDRVFPALFLFVPLVFLIRSWVARGSTPNDRPALGNVRFIGAFLGVLTLGVVVSSFGALNWSSFIENIEGHGESFFLNQISLRSLFIVDPVSAWGFGSEGWSDGEWWRQRRELEFATTGRLLCMRVWLIGLIVVAAWRVRDSWQLVGPSTLAPFVLLYPANYYFSFLALGILFYERARSWVALLVGFQIVAWILGAIWFEPPEQELLNWALSALLLAVLVGSLARSIVVGRSRSVLWLLVAAGVAAFGIGWAADAFRTPDATVPTRVDLTVGDVEEPLGFSLVSQSMAKHGNGWEGQDLLFFERREDEASVSVRCTDAPAKFDRLRIRAATAPVFGRYRVELGGQVLGSFDFYSSKSGLRTLILDLESPWGRDAATGGASSDGTPTLRFVAEGRNAELQWPHLGLDTVDFEERAAADVSTMRANAAAWLDRETPTLYDGSAGEWSLMSRLGRPIPDQKLQLPRNGVELGERLQMLSSLSPASINWSRLRAEYRTRLVSPQYQRSNREPIFARILWNEREPNDPIPIVKERAPAYWEYYEGALRAVLDGGHDPEKERFVELQVRELVLDWEGWSRLPQGSKPQDPFLSDRERWSGLATSALNWADNAGRPDLMAEAILLGSLSGGFSSPDRRRALERMARYQELDGSFGVGDPIGVRPKLRRVLLFLLAAKEG